MNWKREISIVIAATLIALIAFMVAGRRIQGDNEIRTVVVTAYCPCDTCTDGDYITASGHHIRPGDTFCAASGEFDFYDKVTIPGYNNNRPTVVLDRGGYIQRDRLDVYFQTHAEAIEWGHKKLQVTIHR